MCVGDTSEVFKIPHDLLPKPAMSPRLEQRRLPLRTEAAALKLFNPDLDIESMHDRSDGSLIWTLNLRAL